jgi:hypothetical protein
MTFATRPFRPFISWGLAAEPGAAPDRGRNTGFARHQALAADPAGDLGR